MVPTILSAFAPYFQATTDSVTILTNEGDKVQRYFPNPNFASLMDAVSEYPKSSEPYLRTIDAPLLELMNGTPGTNPCRTPKILFLIVGDDGISDGNLTRLAELKNLGYFKIYLMHLPGQTADNFRSSQKYQDAIAGANGVYMMIRQPQDEVSALLNSLTPLRQNYSASFRANNGDSGNHTIEAEYNGQKIRTLGKTTYAINLADPVITLNTENAITRTAIEQTESGFTYDKNSLDVFVNLDWKDNYPRQISTSAILIVQKGADSAERIPITLTNVGENNFKFNWNYAKYQEKGNTDISLSLEMNDEFGTIIKSSTNVPVTLINNVPMVLLMKAFNWVMYALAGVVVFLFIIIIIMWSKIARIASMGGQVISKAFEEVRKTIVGGGRKGKPLASMKIIDGPAQLIGQTLQITTETARLGRDPKLADFTFYSPDALTSLSSHHATLERKNGRWFVRAESQSGSEVFIENKSIEFFENVPISSGQIVRLGYLAQQPVIFEFHGEVDSKIEEKSQYMATNDPDSQSEGDMNKTDVYMGDDDNMPNQRFDKDDDSDVESIFGTYRN
jgi:hypothetical protein